MRARCRRIGTQGSLRVLTLTDIKSQLRDVALQQRQYRTHNSGNPSPA
jgi:hypothetical protein